MKERNEIDTMNHHQSGKIHQLIFKTDTMSPQTLKMQDYFIPPPLFV